MRSDSLEPNELLESTSFFMRASLVQAHKEPGGQEYPPVFIPTGQDAASGDVIQTPERLKLLDGRQAALCVFAKLSVRLPGVFRLKFTLFETSDAGVSEVGHTTTEPFEVFSPKLFTGMAGSTPLTRHLAAQGLKVKLRPDTVKQSVAKRRNSGRTTASSSSVATIPPSARPLDYPGRLVWRNTSQEPSQSASSPFDWGTIRRTGDDGMFPSFRAISGQMDWTPTPPSERYDAPHYPRASSSSSMQLPSLDFDLQQFSLGISDDSGSRSRYNRASLHGHSHSFMPGPHPLSLQNRSSAARSEAFPAPTFAGPSGFSRRAGDDGVPVLPPLVSHQDISNSSRLPPLPPAQIPLAPSLTPFMAGSSRLTASIPPSTVDTKPQIHATSNDSINFPRLPPPPPAPPNR